MHFGVRGSTPPAFSIHKIEQSAARLRVTFEQKQSLSQDTHAYLAWAPLGKLEPRDYELELYDATRKKVVLMRTVNVVKWTK
jgi:hypothetical protein